MNSSSTIASIQKYDSKWRSSNPPQWCIATHQQFTTSWSYFQQTSPKFKTSSSGLTQALSFSTNFVFAIVPETPSKGGHGIAFTINNNHVGIDVNNLKSIESATATYFSDQEGKNISVELVACGRKPIKIQGLPKEVILVDWVFGCSRKGAILDASDPKLEGNYVVKEIELVLKLGLLCSHSTPAVRPSMRLVMQLLDGDAELQELHMRLLVL
ncbi:l-type lectin-domain containing receptor kinase iv.4, partial [Quercus suber]